MLTPEASPGAIDATIAITLDTYSHAIPPRQVDAMALVFAAE